MMEYPVQNIKANYGTLKNYKSLKYSGLLKEDFGISFQWVPSNEPKAILEVDPEKLNLKLSL